MKPGSCCASFLTLFWLGIASVSTAQSVVEAWQINPSNCALTGNSWLAQPNPGHAIDFIPASALYNSFEQDILVLLTDETGNAPVRILSASTGTALFSFNTFPTGSGFRDHARLATSDDGYIFIAGADGTVQRYTVVGGLPTPVISVPMYGSISGTCRTMAVTGSHSAGTLKVFIGRQGNVVIFGSTAPGGSLALLGSISTGVTGDLMAIAATNDRVFACSVPSAQVRVFDVTYAPFSYTSPVLMTPYEALIKNGMDVTPSGNRLAMSISGIAGGECAVGDLGAAADVFINIPALASVDRTGNGLYDGGLLAGFASSGGTSDVCIEPGGEHIYAYFPHVLPNPGARSSAVFKISVSSSSVFDWAVY